MTDEKPVHCIGWPEDVPFPEEGRPKLHPCPAVAKARDKADIYADAFWATIPNGVEPAVRRQMLRDLYGSLEEGQFNYRFGPAGINPTHLAKICALSALARDRGIHLGTFYFNSNSGLSAFIQGGAQLVSRGGTC